LTAAGQKLLSVAELQKIVVFDFNGATPNPGAKGMSHNLALNLCKPVLITL
jgi:hypothetical protein